MYPRLNKGEPDKEWGAHNLCRPDNVFMVSVLTSRPASIVLLFGGPAHVVVPRLFAIAIPSTAVVTVSIV